MECKDSAFGSSCRAFHIMQEPTTGQYVGPRQISEREKERAGRFGPQSLQCFITAFGIFIYQRQKLRWMLVTNTLFTARSLDYNYSPHFLEVSSSFRGGPHWHGVWLDTFQISFSDYVLYRKCFKSAIQMVIQWQLRDRNHSSRQTPRKGFPR